MVLGTPTSGMCENSKKREKNYANEIMLMTPKFEGDLFVNEVTWFELAHQYLVTLTYERSMVDLVKICSNGIPKPPMKRGLILYQLYIRKKIDNGFGILHLQIWSLNSHG
jgi:hypothetical protein